VAYAAAVYQRGIPVAGVFGNLETFNPHFAALVKQQGFPKAVLEQNRLPEGVTSSKKRFEVGGQQILEYALRLENTGAEIRVGLFTAGVEQAIDNSLVPLLILLLVMALAGAGALVLVAQTVSRPIHELSQQAEYISMGHLDREIDIKAGGEIWQLAESFKRMQASIKYSVLQMRRHQGH
jgi:two-component system sensor histidine kinase VicK